MPIRQLLDSNAFNPEEVTILRDVFEDTLRTLKLTDRSDPVTSLIAKKIIELNARKLTMSVSSPARSMSRAGCGSTNTACTSTSRRRRSRPSWSRPIPADARATTHSGGDRLQ